MTLQEFLNNNIQHYIKVDCPNGNSLTSDVEYFVNGGYEDLFSMRYLDYPVNVYNYNGNKTATLILQSDHDPNKEETYLFEILIPPSFEHTQD